MPSWVFLPLPPASWPVLRNFFGINIHSTHGTAEHCSLAAAGGFREPLPLSSVPQAELVGHGRCSAAMRIHLRYSRDFRPTGSTISARSIDLHRFTLAPMERRRNAVLLRMWGFTGGLIRAGRHCQQLTNRDCPASESIAPPPQTPCTPELHFLQPSFKKYPRCTNETQRVP